MDIQALSQAHQGGGIGLKGLSCPTSASLTRTEPPPAGSGQREGSYWQELGKEGGCCWDTSLIATSQGPPRPLSPPPSADCYVDLRGSPAPLPSTPTMPLFPHVLDLLAPLDSGRAVPSTESLDDFSDGDIFGPELDTLLDSLVSHAAASLCSPEPFSLPGTPSLYPQVT